MSLDRAFVVMGTLLAAVLNAAEPRTRNFEFEYQVTVSGLPSGTKHLDLWVPVPHDDAYQQIKNLSVEASGAYETGVGMEGNTMTHLGIDNPQDGQVRLKMTFQAARTEHVQPRLARDEGSPDENPKALAEWLKPDRLVPIDGQIRTWAREVVEKSNAHTDLEMARAIYNHVVATVKYDKTGKGWGRGDIYYACDARRGNCTDFHAIFIGYCRALRIPARFAIGFPLPEDHGEGKIAGYHCWAEFYAKGIGWIPIDASEAAKNPSKREYFFGAHDENRIEFTKGRDVLVTPKQNGEPLNYFVYPYAEGDGKPLAAPLLEVKYRDLTGK
jgi:transglutaminase-like putative cysteine protease